MKKNLYLFGFEDGYDVYHIKELSLRYNVATYNIPKLLIFIIYKLSFFPALIKWLLSIHLSLFLKRCHKDGYYLFIDKPTYIKVYNICNVKKKAIILRNTINNKEIDVNFLKKQLCFSFDKTDCEKYGFIYYNQYTNLDFNLLPKSEKIKYDFYFLGLGKGRVEFIKEIECKYLEKNNNFKFKIIFKSRPSTLLEKIYARVFKVDKYNLLSYKENLNLVASSKVILDIVKDNQTGITLRTLEALVYKKKLITNNKNIVNYEFYDPQNILLLEDASQPINEDFIYSKVKAISPNILSSFGVINVFKKIAEEIDAHYK